MLPNKGEVIKLYEETPLRFKWDVELIKLAVRICINNGWTHIPSPDELRALPSSWTEDILRMNDAIKFQLDHIKGATPDG